MAARFATANADQATSTDLRRRNAIARMPHGLDGRPRAKLLPQSTHADVDDVRARVEVVSPHVGEEALAAHDLAATFEQAVQHLELAVRERDDAFAQASLPARDIKDEVAGAEGLPDAVAFWLPYLHADAGEELVERKGLRAVAARAEPEAAQLRGEVGSRRDDHNRQRRLLAVERP